jgi:hypothetical protein
MLDRLTHYLIKRSIETWMLSRPYNGVFTAGVAPAIVANAYAQFVASLPVAFRDSSPVPISGPQGAFTHRFATAMRDRLGLKCEFVLKEQTEFSEPRVRINVDIPDTKRAPGTKLGRTMRD